VLAYDAVTITRVDQLFVAALDQFFVAEIMPGLVLSIPKFRSDLSVIFP